MRGEAEAVPLRDGAVDYAICTRLCSWLPPRVLEKAIAELKHVARRGVVVELRVTRRLGGRALLRSLAAEIRAMWSSCGS